MTMTFSVWREVAARARAHLETFGQDGPDPASVIGWILSRHVRASSIRDVVLVRRDDGLWLANVLFTGMPPGIPDAFGTPDDRPLGSKEAALEDAAYHLALAWRMADRNAATSMAPDNERAFDLGGMTLFFDRSDIEMARTGLRLAGDRIAAAPIRGRLRQRLDTHFRGPVTRATWDSIPADARQTITALALALLTFGEFRITSTGPDDGDPLHADGATRH